MPTLTRKIVLYPVGDKDKVNETYAQLRAGIKMQTCAMNMYISAMYALKTQHLPKDKEKEALTNLAHLYGRLPDKTKPKGYSAYEGLENEYRWFIKGVDSLSQLTQKVSKDFKNAVSKKHLMSGGISLPSYRDTHPLLIRSRNLLPQGSKPIGYKGTGFYHFYESPGAFTEAMLGNGEPVVFVGLTKDLQFKCVFGNRKKSDALRHEILAVFAGEYKVQGSSVGFDKTGKKIILNLSMEVPKQIHKLDENTVVGVDLGLAIPAVVALNNDDFARLYVGDMNDFLTARSIGNREEFLEQRQKISKARRSMQHSLKTAHGGHGRTRKLQALRPLKEKERRFVKTKNHQYSRAIIDFALKHHAKYINIEDLKGIAKETKNQFVLRNWSYFELQQMIEYKAAIHGIEVRKVNPYHTLQTCSCCGHWEEGQRISQSEFVCKNPECLTNEKDENGKLKRKYNINADLNAARNIAKSTAFVKEKDEEEVEPDSFDEVLKEMLA